MSTRTNETVTYFYDAKGKQVFRSRSYSFRGGDYGHDITQLGDDTYEISATFDGEELVATGAPLPDLYAKDLSSYFSGRLTPAMRTALAIMELEDTPIERMVMVSADYVRAGVYAADGYVFTRAGTIHGQYDLCVRDPDAIWEDVEELAGAIKEKGLEGFAAYLNGVGYIR